MADFGGKVKRLPIKNARRAEKPSRCKIKVNVIRFHPLVFCRKGRRHFADVSPDFFAHRLAAARLGQRKDEHARDDGYNQEDHAAGNAFVVFCSGFCMSMVPLRFFRDCASGLRAVQRVGNDFCHHFRRVEHAFFADVCVPNSSRMACGCKILVIGALANENILYQTGILFVCHGFDLLGEFPVDCAVLIGASHQQANPRRVFAVDAAMRIRSDRECRRDECR